MKQIQKLRVWCSMLALTAFAPLGYSQILIGQTVGVTGAVAATVKEANAGAMLHLNAVNAAGGVGGSAN